MQVPLIPTTHVLDRPDEVVESAKKYFPAVTWEFTSFYPQGTVRLILSHEVRHLELSNAVDSRLFSEALENLAQQLRLNQLIGEKKVFSLEGRFRLAAPLKWQKFKREEFEQNGGRCVAAIVDHLEQSNPATSNILRTLGLAPEQVDQNPTTDDLALFTKVIENIQHPDKQKAKENFVSLFPGITLIFAKRAFAESVEKAKIQPNLYKLFVKRLQEGVIGQKEAVEQSASALATQEKLKSKFQEVLDVKSRQKMNSSFLFVGPSGVGKTELALTISKLKNERFLKVSMETYTTEVSHTKLFGSPPGYEGSTDKPHFAIDLDNFDPTTVRKDGNRTVLVIKDVVLLFDEFEKAHPKVKQSLLTLIDEYYVNMEYTSKIEAQEGSKAEAQVSRNLKVTYLFSGCIIVCTSNLYHQRILEAFQQNKSNEQIAKLFRDLNQNSPIHDLSLSPELLNRIRHTVPFGPIPKGKGNYQAVIERRMNDFFKSLQVEYDFKSVGAKNLEVLLQTIESKIYGDGIGLRQIAIYFEKNKTKINEAKSDWGELSKIRLEFYASNGNVYFRPLFFYESIMRFIEVATPVAMDS